MENKCIDDFTKEELFHIAVLLSNMTKVTSHMRTLAYVSLMEQKIDVLYFMKVLREESRVVSIIMAAMTASDDTRKEMLEHIETKSKTASGYSIEEMAIVAEDILRTHIPNFGSNEEIEKSHAKIKEEMNELLSRKG